MKTITIDQEQVALSNTLHFYYSAIAKLATPINWK
jgi:hypothetical protein